MSAKLTNLEVIVLLEYFINVTNIILINQSINLPVCTMLAMHKKFFNALHLLQLDFT